MKAGRPAAAALLCCCFLLAPVCRAEEIAPERSAALFSRVDAMLADVREIMDFGASRPVRRALLSRRQINALVRKRLAQEVRPEEIRREEAFLRAFGLAADDFDLKQSLVDVLTEQATALYDYKTRNLYIAAWTPEDMQEFALVHELVHAAADQRFGLRRFVRKSRSADEDLARAAVIEGQASWVMTEWVMRRRGQSLAENRLLAVAAASASRIEAKDYPVYAQAPLYIRETMIFPYADGLLFQQALIERYGKAGFARIFEQPPLSTQHILQPELYYAGVKPRQAVLPALRKPKGYRKIQEGVVGQLEHEVLLRRHLGEDRTFPVARKWRGANYELYESRRSGGFLLRYASLWADEEAAAAYWQLYKQVCTSKWGGFEVSAEAPGELRGAAANGRFVLVRKGALVQALEGLPAAGAQAALGYDD